MKAFLFALLALGVSHIGFAYDCTSVTVRSLPPGEVARSVQCVALAHGHMGDPNAPLMKLVSLTWTLGSQVGACEQVLEGTQDPNATIDYCTESTDCPAFPYPQSPFNCGFVPSP